jgi:hypothetical protein
MVERMGKKKHQQNNYSLYDLFTLGDRIAKDFRDESGRAFQRSGIIMAVDDIRITVLWDSIEGHYISEKDEITFETYKKSDILDSEKPFKFIKKHGGIRH